MIPLSCYLVLSAILFACGVTGFLIKRNIITIFMSIELMLNGVNLSFVAFAALIFCGAAFFMSLWIASQFSSLSLPYVDPHPLTWLRSGNFSVEYSFSLDQLSLAMLLVVTGVGFLIHIYSVGYMWEDGG